MAIVGISCFYHDSAAAIISEKGEILAAAQEERFTRLKHDSRFPSSALEYCLKIAEENREEITAYVYYEKPIRVFMRLLETYFRTAPRGFSSFYPAIQSWTKEKIFTKDNLVNYIKVVDDQFKEDMLYMSEHHLSHACSAFYPSPYYESAILCMDAVGEWATTSAWIGKGRSIKPLWEINFPDSLGMLYSAFTYYCGFKVNSGEYKLMGLAPYGEPKYKNIIMEKIIKVKEDGSFKLNMKYFKYDRGLRMISNQFIKLFKQPPRLPEEKISTFYIDIASSIQSALEEIVLKIAKHLKKISQQDNLCLSGGVALNCVSNSKLLDESGFKQIWIQPASGDAGSALGAAFAYLHLEGKVNREISATDKMKSAYLGPEFTRDQIKTYLDNLDITSTEYDDDEICRLTSDDLVNGKIIAWFQGRMEYGPRSLGNRAILGDARISDMQKVMNIRIKNRESFRPFAPIILNGFQKEYYDVTHELPYMLFTRYLNNKFLVNSEKLENHALGTDKVDQIRSVVPAVTHVDNSSRVQTISKHRNPLLFKLMTEFYKTTNCPILINTSFNVRGEPVVCTPGDAISCFVRADIDVLVLGSFRIEKNDLPAKIKDNILTPILIND